jgi:hypothetical protein
MYTGTNEKQEAPSKIAEIPLPIVNSIVTAISAKWDAEKKVTNAAAGTSGNGSEATRAPGVDAGGFDWNVGF